MLLSVELLGQIDSVPGVSGVESVRLENSVQVLERSAHTRVEQVLVSTLDASGKTEIITNSYTVMATGLHYFDENHWKETVPEFDESENAFVASQGPHNVILNKHFDTPDLVDLLTADGVRLRSAPTLIAYYNRKTGESTPLAIRKDAIGRKIAPYSVIWVDAFDSVAADVRAIYTRSGFEMDVILRGELADPAVLGLGGAEEIELQVYSEFLDPVQPSKLQTQFPDGRADEVLDFGSMSMYRGRAFGSGLEGDGGVDRKIFVRKSFETIGNHNFLIESTPLKAPIPDLEKLNPGKQGAGPNLDLKRWPHSRKCQNEKDLMASIGNKPTLLKAGSKTYDANDHWTFDNLKRIGDYSFTTVDPLDGVSFWTIQEYGANIINPPDGNPWSTWINSITPY